MRRTATVAIAAEASFLVLMTAADIGAGWPVRETISELVYHPTAWLARLSFVVHAFSLTAVALLVPGRSRHALAIGALGMVLVALFDTDVPGTSTVEGRVHLVGAVMAFAGVAFAAFTMRRRWPVLCWLVVASTFTMAAMGPVGGLALGLVERFQAYLNGVFLVTVARASDFSSRPKSPDT